MTASGESTRAAPGGLMVKGGCQFALSIWGFSQVVPIAPSGPTQNTSIAPVYRVTTAIGELVRAAPGGLMAKGGCQAPFSIWGFSQVVPIAPSGPTQNTSIAPAN